MKNFSRDKTIEYLFYLFVFLLPWQARWIWHQGSLNSGYWEYGTYSLYATEIVFFVLLVLWLIKCSAGLRVLQKAGKPRTRSGLVQTLSWACLARAWLLVLLSFALLSLLWSQNQPIAFYAWLKLLEGVLLFFIIRTIKFDFKKLAWVFIFAGLIQAGFAISQFLSQQIVGSKWLGMASQNPADAGVAVVETTLRRYLRPYGTLPHPNILGGFLLVPLFFAMYLYYNRHLERGAGRRVEGSHRFKPKGLSYISIFILLFTTLLLTFSRSALLGFVFGLALLWIFAFTKLKELKTVLFKFTLIATFVFIPFAYIFSEPLTQRLKTVTVFKVQQGELMRLEKKSQEERIRGFKDSLALIKKHPILGVGLGNYTLAVHNELDSKRPPWQYQPVHNVFLLILTELGIIGFVFFLLIITTSIFYDRRKYTYSIFYLLPIIFLFMGLFDHYFWSLYFGVILFWLILSIAIDPSLGLTDCNQSQWSSQSFIGVSK